MLADNDRQGVVRCAVDPLSGTHSYSRGSSLEGLFKRRPISPLPSPFTLLRVSSFLLLVDHPWGISGPALNSNPASLPLLFSQAAH